jgi:FkbM family methyltransferase
MWDSLCDRILEIYGLVSVPHRGRDRLVSLLEKHARKRWTGVRSIKRRGHRIETDLAIDDVGWTLYSYGCLDYWDERTVQKALHRGCVCLDIGAHIGYYSLLLSDLAGPEGKVVAFEPLPYTYSFLDRNLQNNGAANVITENAAVGAASGRVRMSAARNGRLGQNSVSDTGDADVRCTTVDTEVTQLNLDRVDFMKVDVEGYELQVFMGAEDTIRRFHPKIMFEVNAKALREHGAEPDALGSFLRSRDYELFRATPHGFERHPNLGDGPSFFNIFALPQKQMAA